LTSHRGPAPSQSRSGSCVARGSGLSTTSSSVHSAAVEFEFEFLSVEFLSATDATDDDDDDDDDDDASIVVLPIVSSVPSSTPRSASRFIIVSLDVIPIFPSSLPPLAVPARRALDPRLVRRARFPRPATGALRDTARVVVVVVIVIPRASSAVDAIHSRASSLSSPRDAFVPPTATRGTAARERARASSSCPARKTD
tara:strand:+ start:878 stop:1471 length:594 start_codon:yes stop_codon:yes gene_type:complete